MTRTPARLVACFTAIAMFAACGANTSSEPTSAPSTDGSTTASPAATSEETSGKWSYTAKGYDTTVTLDKAPQHIVLDAYSYQAMYPYGIKPVGIWGYGQDEASMAGVPMEGVAQIGVDGEFNLEKLISLDPDIIIGYGNKDGSGWTWWDEKTTKEATGVAPFLPFGFSVEYGRDEDSASIDSIIAEYATLAETLGGAPTAETEKAKKDYEAAKEKLRRVLKEKSDLKVALLATTQEAIWYGTEDLAVAKMLIDMGMTTVAPEGKNGWAGGSWEELPALDADVILELTVTPDDVKDNALYKQTAAYKAGQIYEWNDKYPMTYRRFADWMNTLADQLAAATKVTRD